MKLLLKLIVALAVLLSASGMAQTNRIDFTGQLRANPLLDIGTANTYVVNLAAAGSSLYTGMPVIFMAANTNTGASTLNINSLGAITIQKRGGTQDVEAGDIQSGAIIFVIYDGGNFQLVTTGGTDAGNCGTSMTPTAFMTASSSTDCQTPDSGSTLDGSGNAAFSGSMTTGAGATNSSLFTLRDQTSTPTAPPTNYTRVYTKASQTCYESPAGVETCGGGGGGGGGGGYPDALTQPPSSGSWSALGTLGVTVDQSLGFIHFQSSSANSGWYRNTGTLPSTPWTMRVILRSSIYNNSCGLFLRNTSSDKRHAFFWNVNSTNQTFFYVQTYTGSTFGSTVYTSAQQSTFDSIYLKSLFVYNDGTNLNFFFSDNSSYLSTSATPVYTVTLAAWENPDSAGLVPPGGTTGGGCDIISYSFQ